MTDFAVPAAAVLDGVPLAQVAATEWRLTRQEIRSVHQSATGERREILLHRAPDLPLLAAKARVTIAWDHLGPLRRTVQELMAVPGEHTLALWRRETLTYAGDGARTTYRLPNRWSLATDTLSPPDGRPATDYAAEIKITRTGAPLTVSSQPAATFDAGLPPAGEAWFAAGEPRFQLPAPAAAGDVIFLSVVPLYRVLRDPATPEKRLTSPLREPHALVLLEV